MSTLFTINAPAAGTVRLSKAILLYEGAPSENAHATIHDIGYTEGRPEILAGKAAHPRAALALVRALSRVKPSSFIPPELLYQDGHAMIWWVPPAARRAVFRAGAIRPEEVDVVVPHPGLVFMAENRGGWRVWAVDSDARPTPATTLYRAPYLNVSLYGAICRGDVRTPSRLHADDLPRWNHAFFESRFTHPNTKDPLIAFEAGICAFWSAMVDGTFGQAFPVDLLIRTERDVAALIAAVNAG